MQRAEQQAAENRTLRLHVEQLSGQVALLDADYTRLAATLRALELMRRHMPQRAPRTGTMAQAASAFSARQGLRSSQEFIHEVVEVYVRPTRVP